MHMGAYIQSAVAHAQAGRVAEATALMESAVRENPTSAQGRGLLGSLLMSTGRTIDALEHLRRAHELAPGEAHLAFQLGAVLAALEKPLEGLPFMQRAVDLNGKWMPGLLGFARTLQGIGDFDRSEGVYRRALEVDARNAEAECALGGMLIVSGRVAEAVDLFRRAAREHPGDAAVQGKLLSALNYAGDARPEEVFEAHRQWGRLVMGGAEEHREFRNARDAGKKLRVGLLSTDLWDHSCAYFLHPLLAGRDGTRVEFIGYSTVAKSDWMTELLRAAADGWRVVAGLSERALVDRIREDELDVLIELSGHTAQGPLGALRRRAAPVQATYLGYPNTTGLPTIDWRIVDEVTDPPGSEQWCTERLARIEGCFLCYGGATLGRSDGEARGNRLTPSGVGGTRSITFGSFNSIRKLGPEVVRVWADVLKAVPRSRLLIKTRGIGTPAARRNFDAAFAREGIEAGRVELLDGVPNKDQHLAMYGRVDIGLDTFPYNGTTTTCEAMWMGVPVVTLEGTMHAGRVGAGLLRAVGLPDLVAKTPAEFVTIAAGLAQRPEGLDGLRGSMPARVRASALCDGRGFAVRFERVLRMMWRAWCER